ncbi:hypothetical protein [Magnetospirillum molischianum]|uniref:Uncharacterized protein n=1 Tax=Magnetospirillum molischianum DSM 120 TaxID=1150626 RepID=H8FWH5_MAGML|nr:hypothetical protein [Magnetospirillum molischianum]CCG42713.1 hypothetical protein PHAMO_400094 [Magnetospirillum molischianum DSM 120]
MTQTVPKPSQPPRRPFSREGRPAEIEGMALVALRTMSPVEMAQVTKALKRGRHLRCSLGEAPFEPDGC